MVYVQHNDMLILEIWEFCSWSWWTATVHVLRAMKMMMISFGHALIRFYHTNPFSIVSLGFKRDWRMRLSMQHFYWPVPRWLTLTRASQLMKRWVSFWRHLHIWIVSLLRFPAETIIQMPCYFSYFPPFISICLLHTFFLFFLIFKNSYLIENSSKKYQVFCIVLHFLSIIF